MSNFMRRWLGNRVVAGRPATRSTVKPRLTVQALEARDVPATFTVTSTGDTTATGTLRWAVGQANSTAGADTIAFDASFNAASTINLTAVLPSITESVTIAGKGANLLTIGASGTGYRGFYVSTGNLTFDGLTLSGFTNSSDGGAVFINTSQSLTVTNSVVSGNTATSGDGGAFYFNTGGGLTITNSTFANNKATASGARGGAGYIYGAVTAVVTNSTFVGNQLTSAAGTGYGGVFALVQYSGSLTVRNSTFTGNTAANGFGGAIANASTVGGGVSVTSSIIAANGSGTATPDLRFGSAFSITATNSAIGSAFTNFTAASANNLSISDTTTLALDTLKNNGGPVPTIALLTGSVAIDKGSNPAALSFDERGTGFPRTTGKATDIGAFETTSALPSASGGPYATVTANTPTYTFTVTYADTTNINYATVNGNNNAVLVTGPYGYSKLATFVSATPAANAKSIAATYSVPGGTPGINGTFDGADNGTYTITVQGGQVFDADPTPNSIDTIQVGTFGVAIPALITVNSTGDDTTPGDGLTTLREAIIAANAGVGTLDTITFDSTVFTGAPITLSAALDTITDSVVIQGKGAVVIDGATAYSAFNVFSAAATLDVTLSDLTIQNGSTSVGGGAIRVDGEKLTLSGVTVQNNASTTDGGGLYLTNAVTLSITNSTFKGNTASGASSDGAAVYVNSTSTVSVVGSTFSGNVTGRRGGAFYFNAAGPTDVINSTFSGNAAGGDNTSTTGGGGGSALSFWTGTGNIVHSTFTGNSVTDTATTGTLTTGTGGGAIGLFSGSSVTVTNSIIAGNTDTNTSRAFRPSFYRGAGTLTVGTSVIGVADTASFTYTSAGGNITGTTASPLDPQLEALAGNGGPTQTHALKSNSPAINIGAATTLTVDQRGQARNQGGAPDAGAFESAFAFPGAKIGSAPNVTVGGSTTGSFTVIYTSINGVKVSTVGASDVTLTGPGGPVTITGASANPNANGSPVTVTYTYTAPGGTYDSADNGAYTIAVNANEVQDTAGQYVQAATLGSFNVTIGSQFTVTSLGDSGPGTLRQAILDANAKVSTGGEVDTITFQAGLNGTISLTATLDTITDSVIIDGTGHSITVDGGGAVRLFDIYSPTAAVKASLTNLTLQKGAFANGAAFSTVGETVTLTNVNLLNNAASASSGGGAIWAGAGSSISITGGTVANNTATAGGGGAINVTGSSTVSVAGATFAANTTAASDGGAIYADGSVTITVADSTFQGNVANGTGSDGGAIYLNSSATVTVQRSTFSGNAAGYRGGALYFNSAGTFDAENATFANNTAGSASAGSGGAVVLWTVANASVRNSTFTGNAVTGNGGAIAVLSSASLALVNSIVAGNTATGTGPDVYRPSGAVTVTTSVIGVADAFTYTDGGGNVTGTAATPLNAKLAPLGNYGGPTQTVYLQTGSPAIDLGGSTTATTDQRGLARVVGGKLDAGAVERNGSIPSGSVGTAASVTVAGGTSYTFTVVYVDDAAIKASSVNGNTSAVTVTGPNGPFAITAAVAAPNADASAVTVTYTATPPGGSFDATDSGQYTITVAGSQVQNTAGVFAPTGAAGTFVVSIAGTVQVTNTNDTGAGSFRDALAQVNKRGFTNDTITFQPGLTGTITLGTDLPAVTDSVTIQGAGATVTVDGASGYRSGLNVTDGTSRVLAVAVSDLTFQNGSVTAGSGAGFNLGGESLTLTRVGVLNNASSGSGGGIYTSGAATLTLTDVTVSGNSFTSTFSYGGGLYVSAAASVTVTRGAFTNNTSTYYGGGVAVASAASTVAFDSVTFSGNTANSTGLGGALYLGGSGTYTVNGSTFNANTAGGSGGAVYQSSGALTSTDSTFSDNSAGANTVSGTGGALYLAGGTATLNYATVAGNTLSGSSTSSGGGGIRFAGTSLTVTNSIIGGNTIGAGQVGVDVYRSSGTAVVNNSVVGVADDFTFTGTGNLSGTVASPLDPQLEALALVSPSDPTQTRALKANSPAINIAGSPTLTVDQRGQTRNQGGAPDAGAFESAFNFPVAKFGTGPTITTGGTSASFTIVYSSINNIKVSTIGTGDVTVTGPGGPVTVSGATASPNANGSPVTVTYTFDAPGGTFDPADNGAYTIAVNAGEVQEATGGQYVQAGPVGSFNISIGALFTVTTTLDSGTGSLRDAITQANANGNPLAVDTITFQAGLTGTIALGTGLDTITQNLVIDATGATVTVDGGGATRPFTIDDGSASTAIAVTITGLTVTNGFSATGGAISVANESVTLNGVTVSNSTGSTNGGGIATNGAVTLTINDSSLVGNVANGATSVGILSNGGGGVYVAGFGAIVNVNRSTLSGNVATFGRGGGIYFYNGGTFNIVNSTFFGNTANADGGAIATYGGTGTLVNTTVAGNTSANGTSNGGGGIAFTTTGTLTLTNSIVGGNSDSGGKDIYNGGTTTANYSLLSTTVGYTLTGSANNKTGVATGLDTSLKANGASATTPLTLALLPGSAAINVGGSTTLTTDQRGAGFARVVGLLDAGAFEVQTAGDTTVPTASGTFSNVTTRKGATYQFAVTLADNVAVQASSVQGGDFTVTGPDGYAKTATLVSLSPNADGPSLVATLTVPAPGGAFDVSDNGTYTVSVTGSITDTSGNAVAAGSLGTFAVQAPVAVQSVVTKLSDGTTTSLTTAGQRSVIPNIVVAYDGIATGANLAASYKLLNTSTNATVAVNVSTTTVGGKTVATVTPVAPLANAYYTFTAFGTAIATANVAPVVVGLDGDDNGTAGGNFVLDFHRFAGDVTGDTAVDGDDLAGLAAAFNSVEGDANYRAYLDLDGDGAVDGNDLAVFAQSFLIGIL